MKTTIFQALALLCFTNTYAQVDNLSTVMFNSKTSTDNNNIIINDDDKSTFIAYFNKHIKDTNDYIYVLPLAVGGLHLNKETRTKCIFFNNNYYPINGEPTYKNWMPHHFKTGNYLLNRKYMVSPAWNFKFKDSNKTHQAFEYESILKAIQFHESWNYTNGVFQKKNILITTAHLDPFDKTKKGFFPEISIKTDLLNNKKTTLFKQNIKYDYMFNIDENGVQKNELDHILRKLINDVVDKKLSLEDINEKQLTYTKELLMEDRIIEMWDDKKNAPAINPDGTAVTIIEKSPYSLEDIVGVQFTEDWFFIDKEFGISKKVKSISLIVEKDNLETNKTENIILPFKIIFN